MNQQKKLVEIGKIVKTSGVKGLCTAIFYVENEDSIKKYKKFYDSKGGLLKFSISSKTVNQKSQDLMTKSFRFLIKIDEVNSPEDALKFIDQSIYVDLEEKKDKNEEDEFFIQDLIGLDLFLDGNSEVNSETRVGKIFAVRDFGAGPLIEIEPEKEYKKIFGANLMFIFNDENFPKIDLEKKAIYLKLPEFVE